MPDPNQQNEQDLLGQQTPDLTQPSATDKSCRELKTTATLRQQVRAKGGQTK